jgi:hypothetical protein
MTGLYALGRKTGGRRAGTPNKRTEFLAQLETSVDKKDPFHAVKAVSLMAQHVIYWNNKAATERAKPPEKQNQAVITDALDRCARILRDLAPYQTPKLAAVIVKGDQKAPLTYRACWTASSRSCDGPC